MNMPIRNDAFFTGEVESAGEWDFSVYKTLLESTLAIPWKIDWATMKFDYIGPQIEPLLGWARDSWSTVEDWAARMHPDDRDYVVNFCVSQSQAGVDHEADYRAMTRGGDYVWIRDVVHVVRREDGEVDSLIGFMFDISERKRMEQELAEAQKRLEALSFEDGLTGVSNRRFFDNRFESEWKDALRSGQPLALVLLDIDHFKQFNDFYGHMDGDDCLIAIGAALRTVAARPRDIVARYGGEEFVILLPETDVQAARQVAERCRRAIENLEILHEGSPAGPCVTASVGVSAIVPDEASNCRAFFESVDRMLYAAKQEGRNRIKAAA